MSETSENNTKVIAKIDPYLPENLSFKELRKEGLKHIGELAGKVWTDHNAHDPGITILEVLVYALMDLGYKTSLPLKDLLTPQSVLESDDNFITPAEALTINPVTITDFRKLLLDIEGVRNAWLEPIDTPTNIYVNQFNNRLNCKHDQVVIDPELIAMSASISSFDFEERSCLVREEEYLELYLNGLYKVFIEKDISIIKNIEEERNLVKDVKNTLSTHRNLCEDFVDICVLKPLDIGVCIKVEISPDTNPEAVYKKIYKEIKEFIQPELKYYTLQELLNKGRTIDQVFEGRAKKIESFGFIDTEELESLEKREAIYLSDLYGVILGIKGVQKIKSVKINADNPINEPHFKWIEGNKIPWDCIPSFSEEKTCIDLFTTNGYIEIDKRKVHRSLSFYRKFELPLENLDCEIEYGRYREELGTHFSIQNDFPVVYGVGDDGLPEHVSLERKTQALQLKAYLLFYDQLFANYAAQLANIRSLFSFKKEQEKSDNEKRTYFTEIPGSVPGIEKLLKFYGDNSLEISKTLLARPVQNNNEWKDLVEKVRLQPRTQIDIADFCESKSTDIELFAFPSAAIRKVYVNQLVDTFLAEKYIIEIIKDRFGCLFLLKPGSPSDMVLVGNGRFKTEADARNEALKVAFLMASKENYNLVTEKSTTLDPDRHYFGIIYNPASYVDIIQDVTENKETYTFRRKQFLDHLLARFGESFTDYVLLQYHNKRFQENSKTSLIEDQACYLSNITEISRNRAKAFNYLEPSWNTDNVSGFEKRISLLAGIPKYARRNLCNFEVTPCFRLQLKDPNGKLLFKSNRSYESRDELKEAATKVLDQLRTGKDYKQLEKQLYAFTPEKIERLFSTIPTDANIVTTKYHYSQKLINASGEEAEESINKKIRSEKTAKAGKDTFIEHINRVEGVKTKEAKYRLIPLNKENFYLNTSLLNSRIEPIIRWKWHINDPYKKERFSSEEIFSEKELAWKKVIEEGDIDNFLVEHEYGLRWNVTLEKDRILQSEEVHPDAHKAVAAWRRAKMLGSNPKNLEIVSVGETKKLLIYNEKKKPIASLEGILTDNDKKLELINLVSEKFKNKKTSPQYKKEVLKYGFQLPAKGGLPALESYCVYKSKRKAMEQLELLFKQATDKKNYLLSGDEGNPEYNFIVKGKQHSFLAVPVEHMETATDRNKALNALIRFTKSNKVPIEIREQPRRYKWIINEGKSCSFLSQREFTTRKKAEEDRDRKLKGEALKENNPLRNHCYEFRIHKKPVEFKYVYKTNDSSNTSTPVFISTKTFDNIDKTKEAYTEFTNNLPSLNLKKIRKKASTYEFGLFRDKEKDPVVVQYRKASKKASFDKAKQLVSYIQGIYTREATPRVRYIDQEMIENQEGLFEWRFYKKNNPLAWIPLCCNSMEMFFRIKSMICGLIPPVKLDDCPPKINVICPEKDPEKYHYRVCFETDAGRLFELISYMGYGSADEANEAWKKNWLEIIEIARDKTNYGSNRKISLEEAYMDPESKECPENNYIAVVPQSQSQMISKGKIPEYYSLLASLFPIYKIENEEDKDCDKRYKYRVVVEKELFSDAKLLDGCERSPEIIYPKRTLWESVDCFESIDDVIHAYKRFYTLVETPNNCRILCKDGCYYIGLVEVLVESSCEFTTEAEAWDDAFPPPKEKESLCGDCPPGGVREFIYAAEDIKNYIPECKGNYWTFKVVSPYYFVVDHQCFYNSETERDLEMNEWIKRLEKVEWDKYITTKSFTQKKINAEISFLAESNVPRQKFGKFICDLIHELRECLSRCEKEQKTKTQSNVINDTITCVKEKFRNHPEILSILEKMELDLPKLHHLVNYFPVYKTEKGYCFRLYWPEHVRKYSKSGLQPCGCGEDEAYEPGSCSTEHPFISSNCYPCCEEAMKAFDEFCKLITDKAYDLQCVSDSEYGPYSFQIVNKNYVLGYHPQQYNCYQEVVDAIEITMECAGNTGMHLLEHILLRPKDKINCLNNDHIPYECCLLPICPDYCCPIDWLSNREEDDPCEPVEGDKIHYLPGTDPYSFWATLALPAWDKRFRTKDARKAFEKVLYKEVPALVGLNILWLSPRSMCKFEDAYRKWMEWKYIMYNPGPKTPENLRFCKGEELSPVCELVACITELESEPPCDPDNNDNGDCNCPEQEQDYDPCCLPPAPEGSIFWSYCPPELPEGVNVETLSHVKHIPEKTVDKKTEKEKEITNPLPKKKTRKKLSTEEASKLRELRKAFYKTNIETISTPDIKKTKSFDLASNFIAKNPSITGYQQLVKFFKRYSLQKDNDTRTFKELLKNATWHLLDELILEKKALRKEDIRRLNSSLLVLKEKDFDLKILKKEWGSGPLKPVANTKTINQINKMLT